LRPRSAAPMARRGPARADKRVVAAPVSNAAGVTRTPARLRPSAK
jgi:hypothetical protein